MPTYHKTKADLVEALWAKMKEVKADQNLVACVSDMTLHLVPDDPISEADGYHKLIDGIIECAWKRGVLDALTAIELGAISGFTPTQAGGGKN